MKKRNRLALGNHCGDREAKKKAMPGCPCAVVATTSYRNNLRNVPAPYYNTCDWLMGCIYEILFKGEREKSACEARCNFWINPRTRTQNAPSSHRFISMHICLAFVMPNAYSITYYLFFSRINIFFFHFRILNLFIFRAAIKMKRHIVAAHMPTRSMWRCVRWRWRQREILFASQAQDFSAYKYVCKKYGRPDSDRRVSSFFLEHNIQTTTKDNQIQMTVIECNEYVKLNLHLNELTIEYWFDAHPPTNGIVFFLVLVFLTNWL